MGRRPTGEGAPNGLPASERAALLSALFPGLGQWRAGRRNRALLFAVPSIAAVAVVIAVAVAVRRDGATGLIEILVQPRWLWALVVVNAVLAAVRIAATADAWAGEPRPSNRPSAATWMWRGAAIAVTAAMLLPHAVVQIYAAEGLELLEDVFVEADDRSLAEREAELLAGGVAEEDLGPVLPSTTTPPEPTTTTAPRTTTTMPATTSTTAPATTSTTTSTTTTTLPPTTTTLPWDLIGGDGRITVLLAGGDFGPGRSDLRTDVMIVASLDLNVGKATLISVSRSLVNAPLPDAWAEYDTMLQVQRWHEDRAYEQAVADAEAAGEDPPERPPFEPCNCYADRINYLHVHTANWVRTFPDAPDPGMEALRQVLEILLGLEIDYYVLVDFAGFVDLVDAIGGVEVTITESMDVAFSPAREGEDPVAINVEPGRHLLDGREALAYVRNRTGSSDGERMRRQRCMIRELSAQADPATLVLQFPEISQAIRQSTTTTIPLDLLPSVVEWVAGLDADDIATMAVVGPPLTEETNYLNLPIVQAPRVRAAVADLLAGVAAGITLGNAATECP